MMSLKASVSLGAKNSSFAGVVSGLSKLRVSPVSSRAAVVVEASKTCDLTRARRNKANSVCFSNKKTRKWQGVNLQTRRIYWPEAKRWVTLTVSTRALKTLENKGLAAMAKEAGIDLASLPYTDVSEARLEYLAQNQNKVPAPKKTGPRFMKNPERLAASTKKPIVGKYVGSRLVYVRESDVDKLMAAAAGLEMPMI